MPSHPSRSSRGGRSNRTHVEMWYCCRCHFGPYSAPISIACAIPTCLHYRCTGCATQIIALERDRHRPESSKDDGTLSVPSGTTSPVTVLSGPTLASTSESSAAFRERVAEAIDVVAHQLATHVVLRPLFLAALQRMPRERLQKKFAGLLKQYGSGLLKLAKSPSEKAAGTLVQRKARLVTRKALSELDPTAETSLEALTVGLQYSPSGFDKVGRLFSEQQLDRNAPVDQRLEDLSDGASPDEDEGDDLSAAPLPDRIDLEQFMIRSSAFSTLCLLFRQSVQGSDEPQDIPQRKPTLEIFIERMLSPFGRYLPRGSAGVLSNYVLNLTRPRVLVGHKRITWTCGCGKSLYADVHDIGDRTAERVEAELRQCAGPTAAQAMLPGTSVGPSQLAGTSSRNSIGLVPSVASPAVPGPATPKRIGPGETPGIQSVRLVPSPNRFLLICVNGAGILRLEHITIGDGDNDEPLFEEMRRVYSEVRSRRRFRLGTPVRIRKLLLAMDSIWSAIQGAIIRVFEALNLSWMVWWIGQSVFYIPKAAHIVQFELAPIKMDICARIRELNSWPPEEEVKVKRTYDYSHCPAEPTSDLMGVPYLHVLFEPGHHMDNYWTNWLPKKLRTRLEYPDPSGGDGRVIGWGVYLVEGLNWNAVVALIGVGLMMTFPLAVVYSISSGGDASAGFAIASYLVAILTLLVTLLMAARSTLN